MSEQTKGFFAANWFKLFFVAFAVILLFIYFERESALSDCIDIANKNSNEQWEFQCKESKRKEDCSLPRFLSENIKKDRESQIELCIKRYSFK
jgi:hypothetical protein